MGQSRNAHKKVKYKNRERSYEHRINSKYFLTIIGITIMVFLVDIFFRENLKNWFIYLIRFFNESETEMICRMKNEVEFLGSAVLTLSTILGAFIIFYYSSLGYRNYGISNRKIISYTYGSLFIPLVLTINAIIVLYVIYTFYAALYVEFYSFCSYSFVLQVFLMAVCIKSSSQAKCYRVLLRIEEEQFQTICKAFQTVERQEINAKIHMYQGQEEHRKNLSVYHIDNIMKHSETLSEKFEILQAILMLPFDVQYEDKMYDQGTYSFLYHNMILVVDYLKVHPGETQKLYTAFYENIDLIQKSFSDKQETQYRKLAICLSAYFHTLVSKKLNEKYEFFIYIINGIISDRDTKDVLVMSYFESIIFLWYECRYDFEDKETRRELVEFIKAFRVHMKNNVQNIQEKLLPILEIWLTDTTVADDKWEIMYAIMELASGEGENDFINYLCQILWRGRSTDDTIVSI